jgi:TRAP transporter TAXI family solute receptor
MRSRMVRYRLAQAVIAAMVLAAAAFGVWFTYFRTSAPMVLIVGAGPYLSDSYELMREVAEVVSRHTDRLVIHVVATRDSSRNITLLNDKQVDLATIRADTPAIASVRLVANLFPDYFQIVARRDSGIHSIRDLIDKQVAIPPFGTDEFRSFWVISDHYDLPIAGVKWRSMPFDKASHEIQAGTIDAIFTVRSLRDRRLLDLFEDTKLKNIPIRYLEIDQADAIAIKRPFLGTGRIPKGTFAGEGPTPARDTLSSTVERVLVTRADVDDEAIAELTRILFEHRLDLTIRFALASAIRQPDTSKGLSLPLHSGAERFYERNEPSFLQTNAEPLALMITVLAMLGSAMLALRSRLMTRQKNRMDSYNYVLLDIAERANGISDPDELSALKKEMFATLENVVRALDTDEVTEEGFQSFSLLWESVREMLNERRVELRVRD